MKFRLTITVASPTVTHTHVASMLKNIDVHINEAKGNYTAERYPVLIGEFTLSDVIVDPDRALAAMVADLQTEVLTLGRFLVTAEGIALLEKKVTCSYPWMVMTDEERAADQAARWAEHQRKLDDEKAEFIKQLRAMGCAKVTWQVYDSNDQTECEGTALFDIDDKDISDNDEWSGETYDRLLDLYSDAIDSSYAGGDDKVRIDTGCYELRLLNDAGEEIEEMHYTGSYDHDYSGGW